MEGVTTITVTQAHCDELGHLNHVEAVRYLERARSQWYRECGLFDAGGGRPPLGTVVVNVDYDYRLECFAGERLRITTRPVSMGTRSFILAHEIVRPDGRTAIDGQCTSVVMDLSERSIIPVPECLAVHLPKRGRDAGAGSGQGEGKPVTERFREPDGETGEEAAAFLGSFRTLHLATASAEGVPEASYAPFVRAGDNAFRICVSDLSRHTGHLVATGRASVLIVEDESASPQPFARRRLVFECVAGQVERGTGRWHETMDLFERKFGEVVRLIRPLADFRVFALAPRRGVFVKGFGQAFRIAGPALDALRRVNDG